MLTRGRYNESNYPVQELRWKEGGGLIFEGGVLAGHYGNRKLPLHFKLQYTDTVHYLLKVTGYQM